MFFPFLPFILALAGLTALVAMPEPPEAVMLPWQVAVAFGALPLLGFLLGHLPESTMARGSVMRFSARRMALLALWMVVVAGLNLFHELRHLLEVLLPALRGTGEATLALLLVNFWVADALSLRPFQPQTGEGWRELRGALAISLPALLLFVIGAGLSWALGLLWPMGAASAWQGLVMLGGYALLMAVGVPALIRFTWRFQRLPDAAAERAILDELEKNGIRGTRVYAWPEAALGGTTAAIIGLVRPFRYMLIGPALTHALTPEELRAVTAHEAAHVRLRHLWYYLAAILGFVLFMQAAMAALLVGIFVLGGGFPVWMGGLIEISLLLLFLRFGIGLLSRRFERQADVHAYRRHGLAPMTTALAKVGLINRIPPELDNWHHYGIARRIAYLQEAGETPGALDAHDRRVNRLKWGVLAALVIMAAAQPFLVAAGQLPGFAKTFLAARLEQVSAPTESEYNAALYLASSAYQEGDLANAERYFRMMLGWRPADPEAKNNLAWLLVTRDGAADTELNEGLRLAEEASAEREAAYIWDTLAEAYSRTGQSIKAEAAADMALRLAEGGHERGGESIDYYRERWRTFTERRKAG